MQRTSIAPLLVLIVVLIFTHVLILPMATMNTCATPFRDMYASDRESSCFLGSHNSATETDSDVPGPGRLLGKAYGFFGRKVENCLSVVAVKLGYGPQAIAVKIRRLARLRKEGRAKSNNEKKLEKAGKQLVKHIRYAAQSNIKHLAL